MNDKAQSTPAGEKAQNDKKKSGTPDPDCCTIPPQEDPPKG
jgi:hypothetical protein